MYKIICIMRLFTFVFRNTVKWIFNIMSFLLYYKIFDASELNNKVIKT